MSHSTMTTAARQAMRPIPIGAKGFFTLFVQAEHLANRFKDAALPPVLATPVMIVVIRTMSTSGHPATSPTTRR